MFKSPPTYKLGPVLKSLACNGHTDAMISEMYYAPTHVRGLPYLAMADWCEDFGSEEQRLVIEPCREIGKLLTVTQGLKSHGLLVRQTAHEYPLVYQFLKCLLMRVGWQFFMNQHVLGPSPAHAFRDDRMWVYDIQSEWGGEDPFWDWQEINHQKPYKQSVSFNGAAMSVLGKSSMSGSGTSLGRRTFSARADLGEWGEIHVHPLFILWHYTMYYNAASAGYHSAEDGSASPH